MEKEMTLRLADIYSQTKNYFNENKGEDPDIFLRVGSKDEIGFSILYTPPIYNPRILICGQNPGNFGNSWDDEFNDEMLKGEVPLVNTYTAGRDNRSYPFPFAKFIRSQFDSTPERKELLDNNTVGMNIWPCQYHGTPNFSSKKREKYMKTFHKFSIQVIRAINPQNIICISVKAFDVLNKKEAKQIKNHKHGGRYSGRGFFGEIPVYLVGHPKSYTPDNLLYEALDDAIKEIESK